MNRKLLAILLCAMSGIHNLDAADRDIGSPFGKDSVWNRDALRTTYEVPTTDRLDESDFDADQLAMVRFLNRDPQVEQPKPRPSTAPAQVPQRTVFDKLHDNNPEDFPTLRSVRRPSTPSTPSQSRRDSGISTPRSMSVSLSGRSTPTFLRSPFLAQDPALKAKLKTIDRLYTGMERSGILHEEDTPVQAIAELTTLEAADKVIAQIKKRVEAKTNALLALENEEINTLYRENYAGLPLVDRTFGFFKPATKDNDKALDAMNATLDKPIVIEIETPEEWRFMSYPGTPPSRPSTPVRFK